MRGALADAAVGDGVALGIESFALIERYQLFCGLERAVVANRLAPRDVDRAGYVAGTLGGFGHARWCDDLAGELRRRADVDEVERFVGHRFEHQVATRADLGVDI